jgi:hypothetical protein
MLIAKLRLRDPVVAAFVVLGAASLAPPAASAATNLVQNPGFETGDFTDWTAGFGWFISSAVDGVGYAPYQGAYGASFEDGDLPASLTQTLSTVVGDDYTVSFAYNPGVAFTGGGSGSELQVFWSGQLIKDISVNVADETWSVYSIGSLQAVGE